jgi:predicted nucleic acid-binding protein
MFSTRRKLPMELARIHYLDASAIVKLFIHEKGSLGLQTYFKKQDSFYMTSLCFVEALMVLKRKRFYDKVPISTEEYFSACDHLFAYANGNRIEIEDVEIKDRMVFTEVEKIARKYKIDVLDAFQIVSVKGNYFYRPEFRSKPILITADKPLAEAARKEKLDVWYCVDEPAPQVIKV